MQSERLRALTKKAVSYNEKPHSAVTDWIERLCGEKYAVEEYDGLVELIESINLQPTGPTEASRAIRKKLKYGSKHRQLRALTILKALVENCGTRFQTTFANERLVDRIRIMAGDPMTDITVKKKLYTVLLSWQHQFSGDPKMALVAGLYQQLNRNRTGANEAYRKQEERLQMESKLRQEKKATELQKCEPDKRQLKAQNDLAKQQGKNPAAKRVAFDLQKEKTNIMAAVGAGSQCASSLVNALQHVNREKENVTENAAVQEHLDKTKLARRQIIRYIQLVENDPTGDFIGTLISTNETIISALQLYDRLCRSANEDSDDDEPSDTTSLADVERHMAHMDLGEVDKLQVRQRRAVQRHTSSSSIPRLSNPHADLADIDFHAPGLQAPMQPRHRDDEEIERGNLSDYSDYDSSEEERNHMQRIGPSTSSANQAFDGYERNGATLLGADDDEGDPFADPDPDDGVATPGILEKPRINWTSI